MVVKPSPRLAMLLLVSHVIVVPVVYVTLMNLAVKLVIVILIFLSLFYYLARDVLMLLPGSWRDISFDQGGVSVVTRNGSGFSGRIISSSTVSPYCLVLRVISQGHRFAVSRTIFPDSLAPGEFRKLRVYLKSTQ